MQVYLVIDRTINTYEQDLNENYSIVVVTKDAVKPETLTALDSTIKSTEEISTKEVINRLQAQMKQRHIDLLKLSLPHFYALHLDHFPSPSEVKKLRKKLEKNSAVTRV
jgi:cell division transport system permease protein